jgi:hypothetical protein
MATSQQLLKTWQKTPAGARIFNENGRWSHGALSVRHLQFSIFAVSIGVICG